MKFFIMIPIILSLFHFCNGQEKTSIQNNSTKMSNNVQRATFGGGCFWCVEAVIDQLLGVESVTSGYAGGQKENPTYKEVCEGNTGHAEVIQVVFNPEIIAFDELLDVFWTVHNPTELNRQGNDVGDQYRSIILYENEEQKLIAQRSLKQYEASKMYDGSFTTQIVPLVKFYKAEDYHQNYYENDGGENPYCTTVVQPKIEKFRKKFHDILKPEYK